MKHFLKGAAVTAIVLIVLMIIHMFCNIKGIQLDQVAIGTISAVCAMFIYQGLIRNEQNKEEQK